jgi:cytochrome c biogenesis protein CcmG/thiol:disulfide interchange protein DsbE
MGQYPPTTRRLKKKTEFDPRLILVGTAVLIVLALAVIYLTRDRPDSPANATPAPDFTLGGLSGDVALSSFRGQYVLLNFWATWCPPCQAEMPDLYAYYLAHQNDGFVLLGVDVEEDAATVAQYMQANRFSFPVALDTTGMVYERYGGGGLPSSFLIGPDGSLVKAWTPGAISRAILERDVTPRLTKG